MALLQSPFASLPAYRPVAFQASTDGADVPLTVIENAVTTVSQNYLAIGPAIRFKSVSNIPSVPGFTKYFFDIDIQKYCQDLLGPFETLPSTFFKGTADSVVNTDLFSIFNIVVSYEQISPTTGLLEAALNPSEASTDIVVFAISKLHTEDMDLESYIGVFPLLVPTIFLTKSARVLDVCAEDCAYLSYINPLGANMDGIWVELFDSSGVLLYNGLSIISTLGPLTMATVNTGLTQLALLTWVVGAPVFTDPAIASYTVSIGRVLIFGGPTYAYTQQSEEFSYNVVGKCCGKRDLRLHWMNLLSGTDSYTFNSEKALGIKTTSDRGEKALNWTIGSSTPHNVNDVGNMKLKSEAVLSYRVKSRFLTNTEATWLWEMLTSPKVYAEIDGEFIPVIVENTEQTISRHDGKIRYEIEVTIANDPIITRL